MKQESLFSNDAFTPAVNIPDKPPVNETAPQEPHEEDVAVYSVTDLNKQIRAHLEGEFGLVWVQGEISNFKSHTSGHFYFALKDSGAQIKAVMFRGHNQRLKFRPNDGMEVLVRGRITVYEPRGDYQITCELMEPVGAGALQKAFEQLKEKLSKDGLFDPAKKRPLPEYPKHIALVTSPTGAAIRDMLNILQRRYPLARVTLVPTVVQGDVAAPQIVKALQTAYKLPFVDVIVVGRGGGSIEDMWCFNDETLARTIAVAPVPIVSAVGHEIDFTIADFVADVRAPTPSAAAELIVPDRGELLRVLQNETRALASAWQKQSSRRVRELQVLSHRLVDPQKRLQDLSQRADELTERLFAAQGRFVQYLRQRVEFLSKRVRSPLEVIFIKSQKLKQLRELLLVRTTNQLERRRARVGAQAAVLESLSPLKVVARGFSITTLENNSIVRSADQLNVGQNIFTKLDDGIVVSKVTKIEKQIGGGL